MSQVKNLRAMFENKGESTSPPDRGRSPGIVSTGTESPRPLSNPRPLSKVRTSFIAVEKDGRIGLRRDQSGESSLSRRRMSMDTEGDSPAVTQDTTTTVEEPTRSFKAGRVKEPPIPESPRQDEPTKKKDAKAEPTDAKVSDKLPDKKTKSADSKGPAGNNALKAAKSANGHAAPSPKAQDGGAKSTGSKSLASRPTKLPAAAPAKDTAKLALKSPVTSKPFASAAASKDAKATKAAKATSAQTKKTAPTTAAAATTTTKTATGAGRQAASSGVRKPAPPQLPPDTDRGIGFVKPKPKSPTKPVNLPSSLMAPTRSSVSKVNQASLQTPQTQGRSPSRASISTTVTSTLRRQSSVAGRQRPSFGPPPKKATEEKQVAARMDSAVDESFLARMMRPTESSKSKTTDKVPGTPPPKAHARRSVTRASDGSAKREGSAIKVASVGRPASSWHRADSPTPVRAGTGTISGAGQTQVAMEVAQVETAEEAVAIAQRADSEEPSTHVVEDEVEVAPPRQEDTSVPIPEPQGVKSTEADEAAAPELASDEAEPAVELHEADTEPDGDAEAIAAVEDEPPVEEESPEATVEVETAPDVTSDKHGQVLAEVKADAKAENGADDEAGKTAEGEAR